MANVFGVFGAQSFVVLVIAIIGIVPIALNYDRTPNWFVVPFGFLLVAAFATNFEDVLLPDLLNLTEHVVGNLGAGVTFAAAAYLYRREFIVDAAETEVEG